MKQTLFITGTDTGVGKTVLTAHLTCFLRARGTHAAALKPVCSGGRADARALHAAMAGALTLNEINPWYFRAPVAPSLAARRENKMVKLPQVLAHLRKMQDRFDVLLIEGAGGLLSPLGENLNSRDLISVMRATPIIVALNKLGVVNHILLTLEALPKNIRQKAKIILMWPLKPDTATGSNIKLLKQFVPPGKIQSLPWLGENIDTAAALRISQVRRILATLAEI
jgi:dethiobiotin synthetase